MELTPPGAAEFVICDHTIEFNFRDAKQHWGLEDFMNVTPTGVTKAANLSLFMVNGPTGSGLTAIRETQPTVSWT